MWWSCWKVQYPFPMVGMISQQPMVSWCPLIWESQRRRKQTAYRCNFHRTWNEVVCSRSRFFLKFYESKVSHVRTLSIFSSHSYCLCRLVEVKNMNSVCMLYTRTRLCKITFTVQTEFFLICFQKETFNLRGVDGFINFCRALILATMDPP